MIQKIINSIPELAINTSSIPSDNEDQDVFSMIKDLANDESFSQNETDLFELYDYLQEYGTSQNLEITKKILSEKKLLEIPDFIEHILEIVKQQGLAYACFGGNLTHGTFLVSVLRKHTESCIYNFVPLIIGELKEAVIHAIYLLTDRIGQ